MPGIEFAPPSELLPLEGYIDTSGPMELKFEFIGETARTLYTRLPGSSIIRPDKVCSRGLKVPPTVKRIGAIHCERHVPKTGAATYKCIARMHLYGSEPMPMTEEFICGLFDDKLMKTPEEDEQDFQKILSGAPLVGYPLVRQQQYVMLDKKSPLNGNYSVDASSAEFVFGGEVAQKFYDALPMFLVVPKGKACTSGAKTNPTIKRSNGFRCSSTPSPDKKSATYDCYIHLDLDQGWMLIASEQVLCQGGTKP
jgi:hypothetical protein